MNFNDLKEPYFIAEIGINHNGDLRIPKPLIDAAFGCEWDCVKFQKRNPEFGSRTREKQAPGDAVGKNDLS